MIGSDRLNFDRALTKLAIVTREKLSDEIYEVYFDALKDVEIEPILYAVGQLTKTAKFFPKVGEIRELAKPVLPPYRQRYFDGEPVKEIEGMEMKQIEG